MVDTASSDSLRTTSQKPGFDIRRLDEWMDDQRLPPGRISEVEVLGGGTQNLLLRFSRGGRRYVLRHPPQHKRPNSDETMRREARVLGALAETDVPHARLVAACNETEVLGSAFYVMEAVDGANPTVGLPARYVKDASWRHQLGLSMVDAAAAVGAVDHVAAGLDDFGRPDSFIKRQVARWRAQLESYTELDNYRGPDIPGIDAVGDWLDANRPSSWAPGLMHGDFHLANMLCDRDQPRVAAIVDWELSTIGDPLLDLGWLLATWPDVHGPTVGSVSVEPWEGFPGAADLVQRYATRSTRDLSTITWYEVLACYKLGIILEGTHARACAGLAPVETGDMLHRSTLALFQRAMARIEAA